MEVNGADFYIDLKKVAVKIYIEFSNDKGEGSGCIVKTGRTDYDYVFTAKHCLEEGENDEKRVVSKDRIEIKRFIPRDKDAGLEILDLIWSDEFDIAIIKVGAVQDDSFPGLNLNSPIPGENILFYGYPKRLNDHHNPREDVEGIIKDTSESPFEISLNKSYETKRGGSTTYMVGLSGSGIFSRTECFVLEMVGIFVGAKDKDGAYKFNGYSIDDFLTLLEESDDYHNLERNAVKMNKRSAKFIIDKLRNCSDEVIKDIIKKVEESSVNCYSVKCAFAKMLMSEEHFKVFRKAVGSLYSGIKSREDIEEILEYIKTFSIDFKSGLIIRGNINSIPRDCLATAVKDWKSFGELYLKRAWGNDRYYNSFAVTGKGGVGDDNISYSLQEINSNLASICECSEGDKKSKDDINEYLQEFEDDGYYIFVFLNTKDYDKGGIEKIIREIREQYELIILFFFSWDDDRGDLTVLDSINEDDFVKEIKSCKRVINLVYKS